MYVSMCRQLSLAAGQEIARILCIKLEGSYFLSNYIKQSCS